MKKVIILFIITFQQALLATISDDNLLITLPDGQIRGAAYTTPNNVLYFGWRGIPFATPPLGSLRFDAPKPPEPWKGVLDATNDRKSCISANYNSAPQYESEDCLYINVYTRNIQPTAKLPVLFWIYGGAYLAGSSSKGLYGPDYFVEEDVVFVSFNYRLGPFGFLSTQDSVIRGNAALKDQALALKWTHDNIALFGGDPNKITIFGESAGGVSTGLHLLSQKSAGLFRAAIVESGSALVPFAIKPNARLFAFALANTIPGGNYGNDSQQLKEFLLEKTPSQLVAAMNGLLQSPQMELLPVVEVQDEEAFISQSPYELLQSGSFNKVPIIIGVCAEESLVFLGNLENAKQIARAYDAVSTLIIPSDLYPNFSDDAAVIAQIKNIYLTGSQSWSNELVGLARYYTDNSFARGVLKHGQLASDHVPVYLYQFAYYGRTNIPGFIDGAEKATHGAELPFLFNQYGSQDTNPANLLTQNRMVKLWTNFAKFLNPTPEASELFNYVTWPYISPGNYPYLNINGTLDLQYNLKGNAYMKWTEIFETYGRKPFITY